MLKVFNDFVVVTEEEEEEKRLLLFQEPNICVDDDASMLQLNWLSSII